MCTNRVHIACMELGSFAKENKTRMRFNNILNKKCYQSLQHIWKGIMLRKLQLQDHPCLCLQCSFRRFASLRHKVYKCAFKTDKLLRHKIMFTTKSTTKLCFLPHMLSLDLTAFLVLLRMQNQAEGKTFLQRLPLHDLSQKFLLLSYSMSYI